MSIPILARNRGGSFAATSSGGAAAALWTPAETTTLLWLDASDTDTITESSGSVSQWDDKSGNDYHSAQGTGARQPTTGATTENDLNVIDFTDPSALTTGKMILTTSPDPADWRDTYIVAKWTGIAYDGDTGDGHYYPGLFWGGGHATADRGLSGLSTFIAFYTAYVWWENVFMNGQTQTYDASNPAVDIFRDVALASFSSDDAVAAEGYRVGSHANYVTSRTWVGWVGEVVSFSSKLGTDDKEIMEGYLAHKWGIEGHLDSGHTYKSSAPTV